MFCDLPYEIRMAFRHAFDACGEVTTYAGHGVIVAMSNDTTADATADRLARAYGLVLTNEHYFPLGSDQPAPRLRHFGPYPAGQPGFWRYRHYRPEGH